jgi:hypothetical protein
VACPTLQNFPTLTHEGKIFEGGGELLNTKCGFLFSLQLLSETFLILRRTERDKIKKGKAVPLQACSGPDGSRKLRFPDYMTTAQDGGKVVSLTKSTAFTSQEMLLVLISVRG